MTTDVKAAVAEAMRLDVTLGALLPGGVYTAAEISRTMEPPTPFDEVGRMQPAALVRNETSTAAGPRGRFDRHFVLVFFYDAAGYGAIDEAVDRTRRLLHERRLGDWGYTLRHVDDVRDQYDDAIQAYMHRSRYETARRRN